MTKIEHYHFVGIGGIGMSGLARILLESNVSVSGSDTEASETVESLKALGAEIKIGHDAKHVPRESALVFTSMIAQQNPEIQIAKQYQLPLLHRSDLLKLLMTGQKPLLIAGTHGKTTTTSLLSHVLLKANFAPSYAIGGVLLDRGVNAAKGSGKYFVAEADESDGTFLKYDPYGAIITNIDNDHMDHYRTEKALEDAFSTFAAKVANQELLFYCSDDSGLVKLKLPGIGYGFSEEAVLKGSRLRQDGWSIIFDVDFKGKSYKDVAVRLLGQHNALNALAVFGMAINLGVGEAVIRDALSQFPGVRRRGERKGEAHGVLVIDDYGHHPSEIETTLKGIKRAMTNRRIVALFQPHRYTRTRDCLQQFGNCFDAADLVIMTDIYAANEQPIPGIETASIIKKIHEASTVPVVYVSKAELLEGAVRQIRPFDVVVTLGAGNITKLGPEILSSLKIRPPQKIQAGFIFGGQSTEHEISFLSAANICKGINKDAFEPRFFYITKKGVWIAGEEAQKILADKKPYEAKNKPRLSPEALNELQACEVMFPILHGPFGEDGTLQGFLEMFGIAYAGCGHQSAAICMDKAVTKRLAEGQGIAVAPYVDFSEHAWQTRKSGLLKQIQAQLNFPLYVKPVHLGSTVGVKKVRHEKDLTAAIDNAFLYDVHVLVETGIVGREIEFSVFGNGDLSVFPPGEIFTQGAVYDYTAKYSAGGFETTAQAKLDDETIKRGMEFAKKAYASAGCNGFARVDCFMDKEGRFILNEINPIPGFTNTSLYPQMCAAHGLKLTALIDELMRIGLARMRHQRRLITDVGKKVNK